MNSTKQRHQFWVNSRSEIHRPTNFFKWDVSSIDASPSSNPRDETRPSCRRRPARREMSLSATFRATKIPRATLPRKFRKVAASSVSAPPASASASGDPPSEAAKKKEKEAARWCVYLIASSQVPRTYVGVTTDFPRRLRQHNGELKGGAKASSAGRPWNLACLVEGFVNRSEACEFESRWKNISKKMTRKRSEPGINSVLQHREAALSRVKSFLDCSHLNIKWHSS